MIPGLGQSDQHWQKGTLSKLEDQTLQRKRGQEVVWGALSQEPDRQVNCLILPGKLIQVPRSGPDFCPSCKMERRLDDSKCGQLDILVS